MATPITKQEAAKLLGISPYTLSQWRRAGKLIEGIHFVRFNSRNTRYIQESIQDLFRNQDDPKAHELYCQQFMKAKRLASVGK
ncbi:hypothetical protein OsccyDRAFT_3631 [Leptolyngbyaceae cyanobacterium JSC-12]|nr:hypothetical protein OsccyDRAFT_3631 [Leptolyngbyaceae cyanobacterium JSC-12]